MKGKLLFYTFFLFIFLSFDDNKKDKPAKAEPPAPPQREYQKGYFGSPVGHQILLSGNFGELRAEHFHAGLDIIPQGTGEDFIYAAADGYISRIYIHKSSYGNCLLIAHPNGLTTVYAHLTRFSDKIKAHVRQKQLAEQTFEMDYYPDAQLIPVHKGEMIGVMGNSGYSFGRHLHFEVRDSETEVAINPLLYGFPVTDNIAPRIFNLKLYGIDYENNIISMDNYAAVGKGATTYAPKNGSVLRVNAPKAGLAIHADDLFNGWANSNGIYEVEVRQDGGLIYHFQLNEIPFEETRYMNAHIDYKEKSVTGRMIHRCFRLPQNKLSVYDPAANDGTIYLEPNRLSLIEIKVKDVNGNTSSMSFSLQRIEPTIPYQPSNYNYFLPANEGNIIRKEDIEINMSANTLYENLYFNYFPTQDGSVGVYSQTHHLHNTSVPVHDFYELKIKPTRIPPGLENKMVIAKCNPTNGSMWSMGGVWDGQFVSTKLREFGNYCIVVDEIPPTIVPLGGFRDGKSMAGQSQISFKATDNLSEIKTYRLMINSQWVLLEYDYKYATFIYKFGEDSAVVHGENYLELTIADERGNTAFYTAKFYR